MQRLHARLRLGYSIRSSRPQTPTELRCSEGFSRKVSLSGLRSSPARIAALPSFAYFSTDAAVAHELREQPDLFCPEHLDV